MTAAPSGSRPKDLTHSGSAGGSGSPLSTLAMTGCDAGTMSPSGGDMPWAAVPVEVADRVRPGLSGVVEDIIAAVRAEVVEYDQPLEGEFGRLIREGTAAALAQFVDLLGRDVDLPPSDVYEAIGRAEFRAGRTLDALQSAYRV